MSNIAVEKIPDTDSTPQTLLDRMAVIAGKVRQKAFEIFESRGCQDGRSLEDWLRAERDIVQSPEAELAEKGDKFHVRVAIPGYEAKDVRVTATPTALFIDAEVKHEHKKTDGDICFCEFGHKQLFRRLDLPARINIDKVTAKLDHGILELTAPKSAYTVAVMAAA